MSSKFVRDDDGTIRIVFTSQEAHVVINLTAQLLELLGEGSLNADIEADPLFQMMGLGASEQPPEDPVLRRLLPSAYKDQKSASEFRRYTEHGLREKKRAHAHLVYEALTPTDDEALTPTDNEALTPADAEALTPTDADWSADQPLDRGSIEVSILEPEAMAWLGALNDLRLALAVRLGISKEFDERDQKTQTVPTGLGDADNDEKADLHKKYELMTDSDPMKAVYAVYSWLGWLQQSLLEVLMGSGDDHQAT